MIEVLVVDDHAIFRSGLKRLLSDESDMRVADEARNGAEFLTKLRQPQHFNVVLLDISMEGRSGLDLLESVRADFPKLPVLVLSMYPEEQYALTAIRAGANGYVSKDIEAPELIKAIRHVAAGGRYLTASGAQKVLLNIKHSDDPTPRQKLSAREYQIMLMMINGTSLTEIGEKIYISVKTVSTHRSRILGKLGLDNNAELIRYAVRHGIIVE
jgi:two-component system, NarL family, invasion response regulator UvrY